MKKTASLLMLLAATTIMASCASEETGGTGGGDPSQTQGVASGELSTFTVGIDRQTAEPVSSAAAMYPEESDDISQHTFGTTVYIDMANPASQTGDVTITVDKGDVTASHGSTAGVCYVVTGTAADGSLTISGNTDYELNLNNADITSLRSTAVNLDSKQKAFIVLTGTNRLTDGTAADDGHKSTLYGKGKMLFSGSGSLDVYANYNNGIHSKSNIVFDKGVDVYVNSTANHGIKAGDDLYINGGILNVEVSAPGAKGINSDMDITVNGGRTTVVSTANGTWDTTDLETKASAGIKCDNIFTMNGGEIYLRATGSGGKGLKADWEAYVNGGKIRAITEGGLYYSNGTTENHNYTGNTDNVADAYTSSPKGIKIGTKNEHGVLTITGGDIMVRTSGNNAEGIESKGTLDIAGGTVQVLAHDDAINSSADLTISGGTVVAVGTDNDGIDTNGDMYLQGGTIVAMGASGAETGIDIDESHRLYITGGYIFGIGGRIDATLGSTTQGIITTTGSVAAGSTVTIADGSGTLATFAMPPCSYSNGTIMASAPGLSSGSSYTLTLGSTSQTVTAGSTIQSGTGGGPGGMGGGPGGGGRPGGR